MVRALLLVACLVGRGRAGRRTGPPRRRPGGGAPRAPRADAGARRQQPVRRPVRRGRGAGRHPPLRNRPLPGRRRQRRRPRARPRPARGRAAGRRLPPRSSSSSSPRPGRARILTAGMDVRRPPNGRPASWRIVTLEGLSSVDGLYRLRLDTERPLAAQGLQGDLRGPRRVARRGHALSGDERRGRHRHGARRPRRHAVCADTGRPSAGSCASSPDARRSTPRSRPPSSASTRPTTGPQVVPLQLPAATIDERVMRRAQSVFERRRAAVVPGGSARPQRRRLVPAAAGEGLRRGGGHAPLRHADLHALVGAGRGREPVPARRQEDHRALRVGGQGGGARALLQRRRVPRLRRAGLQHRRLDSCRSGSSSRAAPGWRCACAARRWRR